VSKFAEALRKIEHTRTDKPKAFPRDLEIPLSTKRGFSVSPDQILWGFLAVAVVASLVFFFGVRQGIKIAEDPGLPEVREAAPVLPVAPPSEPAPAPPAETPPASSQETALAPAAEAPLLNEFYTVQLIAYARPSRAEEELKKLGSWGREVFILPSGRYYQVCLGKFETKEEALKKLAALKTEGYHRTYRGAFVRAAKS